MTRPLALAALVVLLAPPSLAKAKHDPQLLLYFPEYNRLHRIDVDTIGSQGGLLEDVLIENSSGTGGVGPNQEFVSPNRDVNGMICPFPDGSGRFLMGEDTSQPTPPSGWGVFEANGQQIGKLSATYYTPEGDPHGCAFAPDPDPTDDQLPPLFTTEVGTETDTGSTGQLILWFPPYDVYPPGDYPATDVPSTSFCKIATDIGTAGGIAIDDQGRVYVASASGLSIERFSPPFPTGANAAGGCGRLDDLGSPLADADKVNRETFPTQGSTGLDRTFQALAIGPNGHLFVGAVVTGRIAEYDLDGNLVRDIVPSSAEIPPPTGNPIDMTFGPDGTLYYADLDLAGTFPNLDTGDDGKIWRVRFQPDGTPLAPEVVRDQLQFPDGVRLLPGDLERKKAGGRGKTEWRAYAGGPLRQFFNARERKLNKSTVDELVERWRYPTGAIVTDSPVVARVEVPGEGAIQVVYFSSWDNNVYAVRLSDGSPLWHFTADVQPGSTYPAAASGLVERVGDRDVLFMPLGEVLYALDAVTGQEIWRFTAGTGCVDDQGTPPGLCGFDAERNQIESSPIAADGKVFFGMDVNDDPTGKGGFFAVDVADGRMAWFFDLESGSTCVPGPSDEIRKFDGYHGEAELGLPPGFLSMPGCDFDRTTTGCGNVWSSAALDEGRGLLFFSTGNCDVDNDPMTPEPAELPPYDVGLVALHLDGTPAWRWRPRETDVLDRDFGATPNLFSIRRGGKRVDVVGIGGKDKFYYVIDREGVNRDTGQGFDPMNPLALPYWYTQLETEQQSFSSGGVIGTPAVDEKARRIYIATAIGAAPFSPDEPVFHALDMDTGEVLWTFGTGSGTATEFASFSPVSATPRLVFFGSVPFGNLRALDARTGELLLKRNVAPQAGPASALASGAVVVDGTVLVGFGIGDMQASPDTARVPSALVALCVPGSKGCPKP